jgi:hypothetical protein
MALLDRRAWFFVVFDLGNRIANHFSIHGYGNVLLVLAEVGAMLLVLRAAHGKMISRVRRRPR